jgi:hypothetical protein
LKLSVFSISWGAFFGSTGAASIFHPDRQFFLGEIQAAGDNFTPSDI